MRRLVLAYPHNQSSLEPSRMSAHAIWRVGREARAQLCRYANYPMIDLAEISGRSRWLTVNGVEFETHWDVAAAVHDDVGRPVLGSVEHAAGSNTAFVSLNADLIGDRDDVWRSTAAHELGHAVFEVPGWIANTSSQSSASNKLLLRALASKQHRLVNRVVDWAEWRANEFMGSFLAPRPLLAVHLLRKAVKLGLPLTLPRSYANPVLNVDAAGPDGVDLIALELAETFGLSPAFIHTRLQKYRLLHSS